MTARARRATALLAVSALSCLALFVVLTRYVNEVNSRVGSLVPVLVMRTSVARMAPVRPEDVTVVEMPRRWTPNAALTRPEQLDGLVTAVALTPGSLLQSGMLRRPPALAEGLRSVPVSLAEMPDRGAGLTSGDRVDVVGVLDRRALVVVRAGLVLDVVRGETPYAVLAVSPAETLTLAAALQAGGVQIVLVPDPDAAPSGATTKGAP